MQRSAAVGAALVVASALAFALDGPMARAAYQQGLDPAAFGFWRALAGTVVLGGFLSSRRRSGSLAAVRRMRRPAVIRLVLAAVAGLGLNLALFQAFARLPVAVAVATFGCYPLLVAAWEAGSRRRAPGVVGPAAGMGMATVAVIGLVLLIRPDPLVSVPAAGLLLALLAAVLHAAYILLGRDGWGEIGDGAATFLIVATAAAGLGALTAVTRPAAVLVPVTDLRLTTLLLLEGALAGAAAPLLFLAGLRRIGATQTAVLSLCEPLAATLLAAVMLGQQPAPAQLLGAALLVGAGIAVQAAPAFPGPRSQEVQPREWHRLGRRRGQQVAVEGGAAGTGLDPDPAQPPVPGHRPGPQPPGPAHRHPAAHAGQPRAGIDRGLGHEHHRDLGRSGAAAAELRAEHERLGGVDGGVRVAGRAPGRHARLEHQRRLGPEPRRVP
jgi:DME family drug/metabolite transporter